MQDAANDFRKLDAADRVAETGVHPVAQMHVSAQARNIVMVPLGQLKKSPKNVRKMPHSLAEIDALAASIAPLGMLRFESCRAHQPERGPGFDPLPPPLSDSPLLISAMILNGWRNVAVSSPSRQDEFESTKFRRRRLSAAGALREKLLGIFDGVRCALIRFFLARN
ncbi:hypothetical protein GGD63_004697 [Bradyrhizobium sp. cir1]|uniref:hypothetical protein n=1 Tax=Bradyrhizobium sp. cir1 TaxID=1445730 RepID=UPI00160674C3|nr:hypothetical protein [Bradyrhizobium sp. cir1]MBB4371896.1 hypothetical protein [Bradyrhizobium sp. cir1]